MSNEELCQDSRVHVNARVKGRFITFIGETPQELMAIYKGRIEILDVYYPLLEQPRSAENDLSLIF